jgi:hypothetical protein
MKPDTYCMIPLYEILKTEIYGDQNRLVVGRAFGKEEMRDTVNGSGFIFEIMKMFWS